MVGLSELIIIYYVNGFGSFYVFQNINKWVHNNKQNPFSFIQNTNFGS